MLYVDLNGYVVESVALLCTHTTAFLRIELHDHVTTAVMHAHVLSEKASIVLNVLFVCTK